MDVKSLPDFRFFPYTVKYPVESKELLPSDDLITLNTSSSWTYCGPLLTLESCNLPSSFNTWAEATISGSILPSLFSFLAYVHEFLTKNNQSHYWLTIRASKGSDEFDTPRWHTDDLFFSPLQPPINHARRESLFSPITNLLKSTRTGPTTNQKLLNPILPSKLQTKHHDHQPPTPPTAQIPSTSPTPTNWKLTTTLLGPGTLFIPPATNRLARATQQAAKTAARAADPDHTCVSVRCVGCAMAAESVRARLAVELGGHGIVQASAGECVFFRVGEEGAVHSEPRSHGDRVFVNVVPGHEADLRALMAKWGMEYPRAWCVGLSLGIGEGEECLRDVGSDI